MGWDGTRREGACRGVAPPDCIGGQASSGVGLSRARRTQKGGGNGISEAHRSMLVLCDAVGWGAVRCGKLGLDTVWSGVVLLWYVVRFFAGRVLVVGDNYSR